MSALKEKTKMDFNLILQGKGGVGKSYSASLLAQYLLTKSQPLISVDTDPNNSTLYSIKALKAKFLTLFDENERIDERNFDALMELAMSNTDKNFIIDNGATSFLPLIEYIKENDVFQMLSENFNVYLHVPVTGGQAQDDTLNGLQQLINAYANNVKFIVWINEYYGKIQDTQNNTFENMEVYTKNKKSITAVLHLHAQNEKTFGRDIEEMTKAKLTFAEINDHPNFALMTKQRLKIYQKDVFEQLALIF
ncbi:MAG: conjugal transfer protein TraL [Bacilli bacterium]|nr:conjugal transfer protein TraL [Bacilli bacterium]